MKIIFIGIPGAGKGTLANQLKEKYSFKHVSTGDILRTEVASQSELGKKVKEILQKGFLVSDEIMIDLIKNSIPSIKTNLILDGFPRTKKQAEALNEIVKIDYVINLHLNDQKAKQRLLNRINEKGNKREDDQENVIDDRIKVFYQQFNSLLNYYQKKNLVIRIDADGTIEEVFKKIIIALNL